MVWCSGTDLCFTKIAYSYELHAAITQTNISSQSVHPLRILSVN